MKSFTKLFPLILISILFGCIYISPNNQIILSTPTDQSIVQAQTAFEAYEIAKLAAFEWDKSSILYKIPATFIMEQNLGFPVTGEGWFFMFKNPASPLEYYVYIWNSKVSGTTEAQPIYIGDPPDNLNPIDISNLLDSDDIEMIIKTKFNQRSSKYTNLELIYEKSDIYPKWVVYDMSTLPGKVIAIINALNGDIEYNE
jgi:hypothetical protein